MKGYKILNSDFTPPVQGGKAVWDGVQLPYELPRVELNTSSAECAEGWNFTAELPTALSIAGLWKTGRPSVCLHVEGSADTISRGDKLRCSQLTILARVERDEVRAAILTLSEDWFGKHAERMADSQMAWYDALGRPRKNVREIERGLRLALKTRGLDWKLKRYEDSGDARDAWAAWDARAARAAWAARNAWAARAAWDARAARNAWAAWDARNAWAARDARAAWDARNAWAARDARDALTVEYAALREWTQDDPLLLTAGLRDAYAAGLEIALPTAEGVLGWA